jgi:hypothetical protein
MVTFEPESPAPALGWRPEHGKREAFGRTLASPVAERCQHILQSHNILRLLETGRRQDCRQQIPGCRLLRSGHLLKPQAGLDEIAAAKVIPSTPFRPVPSKRGSLALAWLKA